MSQVKPASQLEDDATTVLKAVFQSVEDAVIIPSAISHLEVEAKVTPAVIIPSVISHLEDEATVMPEEISQAELEATVTLRVLA